MNIYEITFMQVDKFNTNTFHSTLIKSKRNKSEVTKAFERSLPKNAIVINIEIAKTDNLKPGKPCYFIG